MLNIMAGAHPAIMSNVAAQGVATGASYDAATLAYLAAMSVQPDATRKGLIDALITGLKSDGVWALLDLLALPAAHDAQAGLINTINPALVLTISGTMTFTTDRGYAGDGSSGYISTVTNDNGWSKFSQNSMAFGCWLNVNATVALVMGQVTGATLRLVPTNGTSMTARIGNTTSLLGTNAVGTGLAMANRADGNNTALYFNGASLATSAASASSALSGEPLLMNRTATIYSTVRAAAVIIGGSLNATNHAALYARLNTYLTAIGAA
ncbi:hypothetical protein U1839_21645 [Sphingomonas sp. RT2P30]|uniref:hypothetical protein n=1 Tax=Parasphingomonas halimpatiens TaxID=3096162 RepID=UPI002FCCB33D